MESKFKLVRIIYSIFLKDPYEMEKDINKILLDLVIRRIELTTSIIPALKLDRIVENRAFLIWDTENEVKEIDWLLYSFSEKGYSIPVVE